MNSLLTSLPSLRAYLIATAILDLLWETGHLPLYAIWGTSTMPEKVFAVLHCTMGDVLIALASLAAALVIAGARTWPGRRFVRVAAMVLGIGFAYTVFSEYRKRRGAPQLDVLGIHAATAPGHRTLANSPVDRGSDSSPRLGTGSSRASGG